MSREPGPMGATMGPHGGTRLRQCLTPLFSRVLDRLDILTPLLGVLTPGPFL